MSSSLPALLATTCGELIGSFVDAVGIKGNDNQSKDISSMIRNTQHEQMMFNTEIAKRCSNTMAGLDTFKEETHHKYSTMLSDLDRFKSNQTSFNRAALEAYDKLELKCDDINNRGNMAIEKIQSLDTRVDSFSTTLDRYKEGIDGQFGKISNFMNDQKSFNKTAMEKYDNVAGNVNDLAKVNQMMTKNLCSLKTDTVELRTDLDNFAVGIRGRVSKTEALQDNLNQKTKKLNKKFKKHNEIVYMLFAFIMMIMVIIIYILFTSYHT